MDGYRWFEHRRSTGKRGGIAILVRKGISVLAHHSNEFAQTITLLSPYGAKSALCNVYMPPTGNLSRRKLNEDNVRSQVESVLGHVQQDVPFLLVGDFNARTGSR